MDPYVLWTNDKTCLTIIYFIRISCQCSFYFIRNLCCIHKHPQQIMCINQQFHSPINSSSLMLQSSEKETVPFPSKVPRACLKNHSRHLHAPFCVIFAPNSVNIARYASFIRYKSPTNCDAHLTESIFQTRSSLRTLGTTISSSAVIITF